MDGKKIITVSGIICSGKSNKKGEVTAVQSPLGDIVRYKYDGGGNVTSKLDEDGLETLYEYNLANKLSKVMYADGKSVELSYNALRQLTEMKDWLGMTSINMDSFGRIERITDFEGKTVQYEWDALNRRTATVYPDESKVGYNWNESGRLDSVVSGTGTTNYTYDAMGRISERVLPDSTTTKYEMNPLGRLTSLTHSKDGGILDRFKYSYDPAGNITQIDKHRAGIETDSGLFEYAYDLVGRLVSAMHDGNTKEYRYDSLGNRISSLQNGIETKHSYNARNQLIRSTEPEIEREYAYDKRGNLTQITENGQLKSSYDFDATNRMVAAFTEGKGKAEYSYNGFLKRVKRLEDMQDTSMPDPTHEMRYILDLTRPYDNLLMTEGAQNQSFVWGNELLSASGDSSFHYLTDHLGSPIRLVSENQSDTLAYDEFGVPLVQVGQNEAKFNQPFGFTGYMMDEISGLYYVQARYFSAENARFVSEDYVRDGVNWYMHCYNNALKFVDLDGLRPATYKSNDGQYRLYSPDSKKTSITISTLGVITPFSDAVIYGARRLGTNEFEYISRTDLDKVLTGAGHLGTATNLLDKALGALGMGKSGFGKAGGAVAGFLSAVDVVSHATSNSADIHEIIYKMYRNELASDTREELLSKYALFYKLIEGSVADGTLTYSKIYGTIADVQIDWGEFLKLAFELDIGFDALALSAKCE